MNDTKHVMLQVSHESIDALVLSELEDLRKRIEKDLWNRYEEGSTAVFHRDREEDIKELERHRSAVEKVLSWYTVR